MLDVEVIQPDEGIGPARMYLRENDEGDILLRCVMLFKYFHIRAVQSHLRSIYGLHTCSGCDCIRCS